MRPAAILDPLASLGFDVAAVPLTADGIVDAGDAGDAGDAELSAAQARDLRLVRAARQSPDEYRHLVRLYEQRVFATALRLLGDRGEARDVAQEAFLRAFEKLGQFRPGRSFGPWVCAIAANLARDHLRSPLRRWFKVGTDDAPEASTEGEPVDLDQGDRDRRMQAALLQLKPKLREAVVLRYVSGLSVEEVGEALGIGESAAKMRCKRGLERLREILATSA